MGEISSMYSVCQYSFSIDCIHILISLIGNKLVETRTSHSKLLMLANAKGSNIYIKALQEDMW